ncbi:MAG: aminotransferase class I/II-fold pyridoxal phosphate-dependent enzyme [Planctomycetes bacterium]|nr:aminotransferase class I/II-fold pyridoxal phosphate-dependent enzyme [Planctomycetota bacterium]
MDRPYGTPRPHEARRGPLAPDLRRATSHAFGDAAALRAHGDRSVHGDFYPRYGHANARAFESFVAELEGADGAVSFASGMAAMHGVLCGLASHGDRIAIARQVYGGTTNLATKDLPRFGIEVETFDALDPASLGAALVRPARMVVVETPVNPTLRLVDLQRIAAIAHSRGALLVVDGTFAPPPIQRSLTLGTDLVVHSATKFLGGHSDVLAGVVAGAHPLLVGIEAFRARSGAILAPDPAWLLCRSAETHALRVAAQQDAALWIAQELRARVSPRGPLLAVSHPALPDHPDAALRARQMPGGGGALVLIEVLGGLPGAMAAFDRFAVVARAPSLGGVETNASIPAHTTHAALSPEQRRELGIGEGAIRLSIGLEPRERILDDVLRSLGLS